MIHGEQKEPESERLDGRQSPPPALAESRQFAYTLTDTMDLPGIYLYIAIRQCFHNLHFSQIPFFFHRISSKS